MFCKGRLRNDFPEKNGRLPAIPKLTFLLYALCIMKN